MAKTFCNSSATGFIIKYVRHDRDDPDGLRQSSDACMFYIDGYKHYCHNPYPYMGIYGRQLQ